MSAAEHLQEAIAVGCTRDDHDHVADHRAEVLAEAADFIDSSGADFPVAVRNGVEWAVRTLRRMAEEPANGKDAATQAPAGESTQPAPAPDFFQPGHTYLYHRWRFRCDVVTTHPQSGERQALGWFSSLDGSWAPYTGTQGEWAEGSWVEDTEGGEPRG
jgi:hypothetical protein